MVKILEPSMPSGGAGGIVKTAGRDAAGVLYVAAIVGIGLAGYHVAKKFVTGKIAAAQAEAPASMNGLFTVG